MHTPTIVKDPVKDPAKHAVKFAVKYLVTFLFSILFSLFTFSVAIAGTVNQIKGNKARLQLEGENAQAGQEYYVLDGNGKKIALLKITQIRGTQAVAEITKGKAFVGGSIKLKTENAEQKTSQKVKNESSESEQPTASPTKRKKISGGVLVGYAMNSLKLTVQNASAPLIKEDVTLTDASFSGKVFADYDLAPSVTIRIATGYESFAVKGSTAANICSNSTSKDCKVAFDYLTFEGSAHYNFLTGNTRAWAGLGYAFLLQMAKSVDVPNLSTDSGQNQMILISAGADFGLSGGKFIPVVLEYGVFPGSSNVVASAIYARAGYGMSF